MLQQTQASAVIAFFNRFMKRFPSLADLAAAKERDVLRAWEGLGYYRRAQNLHRTARQVIRKHAGVLPDDWQELISLPGIGRYTAGAILSQAYERRVPVVETNSARLLARVFGRRLDPRRGMARKWLWEIAETLLPRRGIGDFNQALMEVGALICTPLAPDCAVCPLESLCLAHKQNIQAEIPLRLDGPKELHIREVAVVLWRGPRVLLVQRPERGRWARLWEFPHAPLLEGESSEAAGSRLVRRVLGMEARIGTQIVALRHTVMHHRITLACVNARFRSGIFRPLVYTAGKWLLPAKLTDYPLSSPQRRLAQLLVSPAAQPCSPVKPIEQSG
jgi:A/G-specific adenine glycosylase